MTAPCRWLAVARAGEDHVFHAGAAQALGGLFAQHPTDGVAQVGFSAAVRPDDGRDAGAVEPHFGAIAKRLETLQSTRLSRSKPYLRRRPPSLPNRDHTNLEPRKSKAHSVPHHVSLTREYPNILCTMSLIVCRSPAAKARRRTSCPGRRREAKPCRRRPALRAAGNSARRDWAARNARLCPCTKSPKNALTRSARNFADEHRIVARVVSDDADVAGVAFVAGAGVRDFGERNFHPSTSTRRSEFLRAESAPASRPRSPAPAGGRRRSRSRRGGPFSTSGISSRVKRSTALRSWPRTPMRSCTSGGSAAGVGHRAVAGVHAQKLGVDLVELQAERFRRVRTMRSAARAFSSACGQL